MTNEENDAEYVSWRRLRRKHVHELSQEAYEVIPETSSLPKYLRNETGRGLNLYKLVVIWVNGLVTSDDSIYKQFDCL